MDRASISTIPLAFDIRAAHKARRLVREHDVKFIIIDYLQLMNASGMRFGSREQEVSMISRSLKQLAKELNIPIVALSQLNRSVENRGDSKEGKRPQLSDLREERRHRAGCRHSVLHPSTGILLAVGHRRSRQRYPRVAEFIVAKHRSGRVDDVKLRFKAKFARFENWDDADAEAFPATAASGIDLSAFSGDGGGAALPPPARGGAAGLQTPANSRCLCPPPTPHPLRSDRHRQNMLSSRRSSISH